MILHLQQAETETSAKRDTWPTWTSEENADVITSYLCKSAAVPQQEMGCIFLILISVCHWEREQMTHTVKENPSQGDSGEGHGPPIESLCPVFVVAIHLAHPFIRSVDTVDSRIPMKARLSCLGWAVGEGCRGGSRDEPSGTALPLVMIVLLEVPWRAWVFGLRTSRRTGTDATEHSSSEWRVG